MPQPGPGLPATARHLQSDTCIQYSTACAFLCVSFQSSSGPDCAEGANECVIKGASHAINAGLANVPTFEVFKRLLIQPVGAKLHRRDWRHADRIDLQQRHSCIWLVQYKSPGTCASEIGDIPPALICNVGIDPDRSSTSEDDQTPAVTNDLDPQYLPSHAQCGGADPLSCRRSAGM